MPKLYWEYQIYIAPDKIDDRERGMNELGEKGWELVAVQRDKYFFKRPVEIIESRLQ